MSLNDATYEKHLLIMTIDSNYDISWEEVYALLYGITIEDLVNNEDEDYRDYEKR